MKKLIYLTFLLLSLVFAQTVMASNSSTNNAATSSTNASSNASEKKLTAKERVDRASLSIRFKNYTAQKAIEMPKTIEADFENLAKLTLNAKQDAELVLNALKTLLTIDTATEDGQPFDPARDMAQTLTESYQKNKIIYDSAFEKLRNDKTKENIDGIKKLWNNLSKNGNG